MTIQEAFECMINKERVLHQGKEVYIDIIRNFNNRILLFGGGSNWISETDLTRIKPKKRYWLWDTVGWTGMVVKNAAYMNENGQGTNGVFICDKENLLKKHENEFIDVEVG
jgi:hypothetical protein